MPKKEIGKSITTSFRIPITLVEKLDLAVKLKSKDQGSYANKSEFIREAIENELKKWGL